MLAVTPALDMRAVIIERLAKLSGLGSAEAAAGLREAAVLVPLMERPSGITVLLAQRTQHLHHHPGQISLPGGGVEATDDGPVAAALRETEEEVGIPRGRVEVIGQLEAISTPTGFHIIPVVGFVPHDVPLVLDPFEVEHVFEVPLEFVLDPRHHEVQTRHVEGVDRRFYVLNYDGRIIWGATALILVNLARHLGAPPSA